MEYITPTAEDHGVDLLLEATALKSTWSDGHYGY